MTGNITMHDINILLEQMEAMKMKILLLQDYSKKIESHLASLIIPILSYSTQNGSDKVK